jgi:DNA-binding transcriptional ArsR family regulator
MKRRVEQFSALGQEDRLEIFRQLVRAGPDGNCVDDIKRRLKMPGSTLSHHLDALTRSGLITARRSGRFIFYAVNWRETANLIRFLTEDCCAEMHIKFTLAEATTSQGNRDDASACCPEEGIAGRPAIRVLAKRRIAARAESREH